MIFIRSMHKTVTRLLFITLGTMWLSFAIAPCVLLAAVENNRHDCCPATGTKTRDAHHLHKQQNCSSCNLVQPVMNSADQFILSSTNTGSNFQPVIIEWNYIQTSAPVVITYKGPDTGPQTLPPPLRFRILLI